MSFFRVKLFLREPWQEESVVTGHRCDDCSLTQRLAPEERLLPTREALGTHAWG